jgi:hypothetical protein
MASNRTVKRIKKEKKVLERTILSTFPSRFTNPDFFPHHDTAMKWWFVAEFDKEDHKAPTNLLSINAEEPSIIYVKRINCFWFYVQSQDDYDYWCDISINEDENGISQNIVFTDMFKKQYTYTNNLERM